MGTSRMTIRAELLRRIGAVPEKIVVQADEYLFTLAATIAAGQILPEPLTYYRVHDANGFFTVTTDSRRERIKQESLAVLARSLDELLAQLGIEPRVRAEITEITRSEADRLRLMLDGGWPWETVKTEWGIYQVTAVNPTPWHRAFKAASLLLALAIPPKVYYGAQRKLTQSDLYLRARKRWPPWRASLTWTIIGGRAHELAAEYNDWHQRVFDGAPENPDEESPWYKLVTEYLPSVRDQRILEVACGRWRLFQASRFAWRAHVWCRLFQHRVADRSRKIEWRATPVARACRIGASRRSKPALREGLL